MWANIQCDKQHLALGVMYRPPSSNNAYLKSMLDQIDNVFSYSENIILMGDLNYDYKLDSNPLHQIEILYGMRQLINSPSPTLSHIYNPHWLQVLMVVKANFLAGIKQHMLF